MQDNNFFNIKVEQIVDYLLQLTPNIDRQLLRNAIIQVYNRYGINENKESLYEWQDEENLYINPKYKSEFPTLKDLNFEIKKRNIEIDLQVLNNMINKNCITSINNTEIYCFHLSGKDMCAMSKEMKIFIPKIQELIQPKTLIYFDEVWKTIGLGQDRYVIETLYNMFKTLRKKKAGIIAISQDVSDLFNLDRGNLGKSILNNTNTKVMFKMEWQDIEMFKRMLRNDIAIKNISALNRGNAHIDMNNIHFNLEIKAAPFEHKLIEGEVYEENINCNG